MKSISVNRSVMLVLAGSLAFTAVNVFLLQPHPGSSDPDHGLPENPRTLPPPQHVSWNEFHPPKCARDENEVGDKARKPKSSRTFWVGKHRRDLNQSIREALEDLGMKSARASNEADFLWDADMSDQWVTAEDYISRQHVHEGFIVNSIPGFKEMVGQKDGFTRVLNRCHEHFNWGKEVDAVCGFGPRSANLVSQGGSLQLAFNFRGSIGLKGLFEFARERFMQYVSNRVASRKTLDGARMLWILKPQTGWNSANVTMVTIGAKDVSDMAAFKGWFHALRLPNGRWTLQEFVDPPLMYKDRKFDVRVWAVVTSLDPLRLYVMKIGIPKIGTKPYNLEAPHHSHKCGLFRMMLTQGCSSEGLVTPYPRDTNSRVFQNFLEYDVSLETMQVSKDGAPSWSEVWRQIENQMLLPILHIRDKLLPTSRFIDKHIKYRRFIFLSPDIDIDSFGRPYIIDLNTNGFMIGTKSSYFRVFAETKQAMQLLGADGFPLASEPQRVEMRKLVDEFCNIRNCGKSGQEELNWFLLEQMHSCSWRLVFPTSDTLETEFFRIMSHSRLYSPTFQDKLFAEFIRWKGYLQWREKVVSTIEIEKSPAGRASQKTKQVKKVSESERIMPKDPRMRIVRKSNSMESAAS